MMRFAVSADVFSILPEVCFGVVVARGINNRERLVQVDAILEESISGITERFAGANIKEEPPITFYRDAFVKLGFNPNKFQSSVEALAGRILKGGKLPRINNVVDLVNAVSLKYIIPTGAHDLDRSTGDIEVRMSVDGDIFVPFGSAEAETVEPGELVYARGSRVKTRRWIWRQSEEGKITEESTNIFFPLDGFHNRNLADVLAARDELAEKLAALFKCQVETGFVDAGSPSYKLSV